MVAATYADGTVSGEDDILASIVRRRATQLQDMLMLLSVLDTTELGASGVDSVDSIDALLSAVTGPTAGSPTAVLVALGADHRTRQLFDRSKTHKPVPKAVLVAAIRDASDRLATAAKIAKRRGQ